MTAPASTGISVDALIRRDRLLVLASAGCVAAMCWLVLIGHSPSRLAMPHAHPPGVGGFALTFSMWMVMMVAMMLPPVMPWILLFATTSRSNERGEAHLPTGAFVAGYFAVWATFCIAAAGTQLLLQRGALMDGADLRAGPLAGGVLLLVAGVFQWTPLKAACLRHCRNPLGFLLSHWRDGPAGAFALGLRHGAYCLGCCWALMILSFAVGVMNLLWMAVLTIGLCVEKIAPRGPALGRLFGLALAAWGVWLLAQLT